AHLLKNSGLPGPRGNLELMYSFAHNASASEVEECFSFYRDDLSNSPEEFAVMCAITGFCVLHRNDIPATLKSIRTYASHGSWRIREAVAIGIQEIAEADMDSVFTGLEIWVKGNELEKRAVVAALCEPKLLTQKSDALRTLDILGRITMEFETVTGKLTDSQNSLRKALGYGWSVAAAALPAEGKAAFEKISRNGNKHIQWIVRENLKKNRLTKMDAAWVDAMISSKLPVQTAP
ncbi:MAG: hypothetical protein ACRCUT_03765, partial [Spirochaetota bacterium]